MLFSWERACLYIYFIFGIGFVLFEYLFECFMFYLEDLIFICYGNLILIIILGILMVLMFCGFIAFVSHF